MGKPSIFSREYEKRMKKRKRNMIIIGIILIAIVAVVAAKFTYTSIDYGSIKANIQAWIDSDNTLNKNEKIVEEANNDDTANKEEPEKPKEEAININLISGNVAKAIYIEDKGKKEFTNLENADNGVTFDISKSKNQILILDTDSTITVYNTDGSSKVISDNEYVSSNGTHFTKENTLKNQPNYLWNSTPKFISENKIVFVTNRPYFGSSATNKYLWVRDITNGSNNILWDLKSPNIEIGEIEEKGIKVTVNGNIYYIDENGTYVQ